MKQTGFALPTILISSVVMIIVMLAAVQSMMSINIALDNQYYSQLADEAAQAGIVKAQACIKANGSVTWSAVSPLRPNTTCTGGAACTNADSCFIVNTSNIKTSFSVGAPVVQADGSFNITSTSTTNLMRATNNTVVKSVTSAARYIMPPLSASVAVAQFTGGQQNVCAISVAGGLYCLGENDSLTLGTGDASTYNTPTLKHVGGSLTSIPVTQASIRGLHGCALAGGAAYCWGTDLDGALGNGAGGNQAVPGPVDTSGVLNGKTLKKIVTGGTADNVVDIYAYSCALDTAGNAYCWGSNQAKAGVLDGGMLGDGTTTVRQSPVAVSGGYQWSDISAGVWHTCGIRTNGKLYCWGSDNNGQVGDGATGSVTTPTAVQGPFLDFDFTNANFTKLASGNAHSCAVDSSKNQMYCWGQNAQGQLGDGTTTGRSSAVKVTLPSGETGWSDVTAGDYYTCGIALSKKVYCWGGTGITGFLKGQIGDGNPSGSNRVVPTAVDTSGVMNGKSITNLWNTWSSSIARDSSGVYYTWGANNFGQLGLGAWNSPTNAYSPVNATHFNNFAVSSGVGGGVGF